MTIKFFHNFWLSQQSAMAQEWKWLNIQIPHSNTIMWVYKNRCLKTLKPKSQNWMKIFIHLKMLILFDTTQTLLIERGWKCQQNEKLTPLPQYLMWYLPNKQYWHGGLPTFHCSVTSIWRASERYTYQRRRYFHSLWYSQDPTVSQKELLTKQVPPPCCLTLWVLREGVRQSDRQNETSSSDHQHPHRQAPKCPGGTFLHCKHQLYHWNLHAIFVRVVILTAESCHGFPFSHPLVFEVGG